MEHESRDAQNPCKFVLKISVVMRNMGGDALKLNILVDLS